MMLPSLGNLRLWQTLLKRSDVQNNLSLNLNQKHDLQDLFSNPNAGRLTIKLTSHGEQDEAERRKQIEDQIATQIGDSDDKIKAVLKPEQLARLEELSLQWQGPLALGNTKTAKKIGLSADAASQIAKAAADYQAEKQKIIMLMATQDKNASPDGSQVMVRMKVNTKALDNPLSPEYRKLSARKKEAEKRVLALLSQDERDAWNRALGAPFTFRTDLPGNRF